MNSPVTHILSLVDTVTHPAAIVNGAAHIIHHNPHFQSLLKDTAEADTAITTEHIPGGEEYWKGRIEESLAGNAVSGILHKTLSWSLVPLLDGGQTYLLLRISRTASGHDDLPVSQATFRKFIDLSRTFILVLDTKGTIVMINETGSRILGRHSDQLIGQNWFTVAVNETDRAKVQHVFTNIVSGQIDAFRHVESEIISLSGARHIIYWHNDAITDADGKIRYIISSGDDITEKRKSQKELLSSNEKYRKLSESIRDIFFSVDDHGQVMFWNSFAENKTGLTSDEIIGQPLLSVLPSLEKTDLPEQIDTVQKSKTPLQTRMKLSFGSSFETYNLIIYPIATGVSILAKDISAQIRFQSQLFEQSQILDQLHEAILTTDMEGRIKTVNKQCLNIFRTNISTIRNEHISSIFNQNDRNRVKQLLKHITPDIPYASEEYAITNADGEMLHTLVHISVKKDINEQPNGYIFSIINISESASIRREILQINQDLEHKVKKRTIQLEEEKRRAESANRAKTSFLANMSHEVRTPMNAIVGLIHLLTQTGLDDVQQQYCRKMNNASQNMMSIIADILDYSRIESGNFELNNSRFRLSAILANLRKTIISMLDGKTITASFTVDDGVPSEFVSDPIQLEHVLAIVLDNAVKFTESGSVHLHISSQPETFNMESVMFKIEDTGIGIKNSDIKQMFQPFTQADDTRSRRYGGAGLGLALAKQLVSRMNGQIRVSSTPGSGSVFTITLPLKKIESVAAPNFVNDASSALVAVDTDAWSRESLKAVFSRTGIQSVVLSDIDEAKPYLADTSYSMCVLSLAALSKHDDLSSISPLIDKKHIILLSDYPGQAIPDEYSNFFTIQKPVLDSQILTALSHLRKPHSSSMFMRRKKLDGIRILLVEDNIINRDVAAELLEMEGAIIDSAENGKSALSVLENKTFDVILMDIKMPVMNGITATEIIKKRKDLSHIPVIALSANTDRKDTFGENFCNVISKPFDIAELVSVISSCIGKKITVSTSDSLIQKMKPIDGINMREPIARQNLTVEEYYAQLQSFFNTNINTLSSIKAAYNENDTDTLLKTVQSLIDDSIKIGAETLAASGREFLPFIVGTCRENDCHFIFADLCFKLDNIMKELSDYFSQHGNHGSGDADLIQTGSVYDTLLGNLGYYLAESDTRALEIIDNLFPITSDERRLKVLMTLKNHCQRFDFEGALHYFETNRPVLEGNHE